jgi:hypothetical protein
VLYSALALEAARNRSRRTHAVQHMRAISALTHPPCSLVRHVEITGRSLRGLRSTISPLFLDSSIHALRRVETLAYHFSLSTKHDKALLLSACRSQMPRHLLTGSGGAILQGAVADRECADDQGLAIAVASLLEVPICAAICSDCRSQPTAASRACRRSVIRRSLSSRSFRLHAASASLRLRCRRRTRHADGCHRPTRQ